MQPVKSTTARWPFRVSPKCADEQALVDDAVKKTKRHEFCWYSKRMNHSANFVDGDRASSECQRQQENRVCLRVSTSHAPAKARLIALLQLWRLIDRGRVLEEDVYGWGFGRFVFLSVTICLEGRSHRRSCYKRSCRGAAELSGCEHGHFHHLHSLPDSVKSSISNNLTRSIDAMLIVSS